MSDDVDELYAHRDDPDEWDDEPTPIEVADETMNVVSFRCHRELLDWLVEESQRRDTSVSALVRDCIGLERMRRGTHYRISVTQQGGLVEMSGNIPGELIALSH